MGSDPVGRPRPPGASTTAPGPGSQQRTRRIPASRQAALGIAPPPPRRGRRSPRPDQPGLDLQNRHPPARRPHRRRHPPHPAPRRPPARRHHRRCHLGTDQRCARPITRHHPQETTTPPPHAQPGHQQHPARAATATTGSTPARANRSDNHSQHREPAGRQRHGNRDTAHAGADPCRHPGRPGAQGTPPSCRSGPQR